MASAFDYLQSILARLGQLQELSEEELAGYAPLLRDIDAALDLGAVDGDEEDEDYGDLPDDGGLAEALNREAEEFMLGRPLFPNEY